MAQGRQLRGLGLAGMAAAIAVMAATLAGLVTVLNPAADAADHLVIADSRQIMSAPLHIAQALGYFADEGLDVVLDSSYSSGRQALAATLAGRADVAAVAETPVMMALFDGQDPQIFATIQASDRDCAVMARRDRGITHPADLRGRRIGNIPGTSCDYVTALFLADKGLPPDQVTIVPLEADKAAQALAAGDVDALSAWLSIRHAAGQMLGQKAITFSADGIFIQCWNLAAARDLIRRRPQTLQRLLRSLIRAEGFIAADRERSIGIVAATVGMDPGAVAALWPTFDFHIGLDQLLVLNLEGQARNELLRRPGAALPNFLSALHLDALLAVEAGRVGVIH